MKLFEFLFKRGTSRETARERLKLVLMQDRSSLPADLLERLKMEIIKAVSKHVKVDEHEFQVSISRMNDHTRLIVNAPFRASKRQLRKYAVVAD